MTKYIEFSSSRMIKHRCHYVFIVLLILICANIITLTIIWYKLSKLADGDKSYGAEGNKYLEDKIKLRINDFISENAAKSKFVNSIVEQNEPLTFSLMPVCSQFGNQVFLNGLFILDFL